MMPSQEKSTGAKLTLSLGFIFASIVYASWQYTNRSNSAATAQTPAQSYKEANNALIQTLSTANSAGTSATPAPTAHPVAKPASKPVSTPAPSPAPTPAPKPAGLYADGSYTGSAADAYYGTVQVQAIVSGGAITDVQFLQYPSDRSTSRYINSQAMPLLTQEAIQAQSAQVSGVSGASETSRAFKESLTAALALAKN